MSYGSKDKRQICKVCSYPRTTCVCPWISLTQNVTQIYVMQHPSEVNTAKGTVRLMQLGLTNINVEIGESENDFLLLKNEIIALAQQGTNVSVLFPSENSVSIEHWADSRSNGTPTALIVLDGTWRKALKIFHQNPWLTQFKSVILSATRDTQYTIRKAPKPKQLSTLEAVACALELLEELDTKALYQLFDAMIVQQMKMMPPEVQRRYQ